VLEGRHLNCRGCKVHLLANARNLRLVVLHIGLLASPQRLFFRDQVKHDGLLAADRLRLRFERGHMFR
jgi:hypothetical protein